MARRQPRQTFADTLAEVRKVPPRGPRIPPGRHGDYWGDPAGYRYELVTDELSRQDAVRLVRAGARVVYDACGCGGDQCELDWLTDAEARDLADSGAPDLHPSKHGRADLEHWHSADGGDLVVAAVEVTWGDRILG